jgi:general secretion pathway protein F
VASFRYRASTGAGALKAGMLDGGSLAEVLEQLRRSGLKPIEAVEVRSPASAALRVRKPGSASRATVAKTLGELAVMLDANITLDRALGVLAGNIARPADRALFLELRERVKEGQPLSQAMAQAGPGFPPIASAMAAAGEANGRPAAALAKLAETLERAEALRTTIGSALVYPAMLLLIAAGVIALMLYWVVPQFETLFDDAGANLPPMTRLVLGVSRAARSQGLVWLMGAVAAAFAVPRLLARPKVSIWIDREVLRVPGLGPLVSMAETARFVRVLASLVEGGVALPDCLAIARRSLGNSHMAAAVGRVAEGLRQGGGLTDPLEATGVFPPLALSYLRTGEETAQLGLMLSRLADVLDREVRTRVERSIAIVTPLITVMMGAIVATVIASIMTAILGFDNLALAK